MPPEDEGTEPNRYKAALERAAVQVGTCRDAVHSGAGTPSTSAATAVASGWECTEADAWITELHERCSGILGAFDDAIAHLTSTAAPLPEDVDAGDPHGYAWDRHWANRHRMI